MFLNQASVSSLKAACSPPCHPESLACCGQDLAARAAPHDEALAGDVMAGAGGAAGPSPAPDVRHQPPGDATEERAHTDLRLYSPSQSKR